MSKPLITVVIPSFNQGQFLEQAICSVLEQQVSIELFVMDGGSTDNSVDIIEKYQHKLAGWRSHRDNGQSAAINEGIVLGTAPYVCWLNSDDFFYQNALSNLVRQLTEHKKAPAAYGKCWTTNAEGKKLSKYLTLPFITYVFAHYCFICQPGTLIRRSAWQAVGGLDESFNMAMDYELWWKLYTEFGQLTYCQHTIAATRAHSDTKTLNNIDLHYQESKYVVNKYWGRLPLKWFIALPLMKCFRYIEKHITLKEK